MSITAPVQAEFDGDMSPHDPWLHQRLFGVNSQTVGALDDYGYGPSIMAYPSSSLYHSAADDGFNFEEELDEFLSAAAASTDSDTSSDCNEDLELPESCGRLPDSEIGAQLFYEHVMARRRWRRYNGKLPRRVLTVHPRPEATQLHEAVSQPATVSL